MIPLLTISNGYAGVEKGTLMFRKEVIELLRKHYLAKEENVKLLPIRQKPFDSQISTPDPDRYLMSTKYAVSVHECVQSKIMCSYD